MSAERRQLWRGAGMALAWEANRVWGSRRVDPALPSAAARARFMDLLYGDPDPGIGLGLNIARFDIGGGADPDPRPCDRPPDGGIRAYADMEGYRTGPTAPYDWSRDASQRTMLAEAVRRGADIVDAFSNSAPWWMTRSLCVGGALHPGEDNLRPEAVGAFADYLATVTRHFAANGVRFESVSPVNEPDGTWWVAGNRQEGSFASLPSQSAQIVAVAAALRGTGTVVSGTEPNDFDRMTGWLASMDGPTLADLRRIDVHQYDGHDPAALRAAAARLGKPLWASEIGCCLVPRPPAESAIAIAGWIRQAMVDLGAEAWCFWQADWGIVDVDDGWPRPARQFDAIAQFTRYIRPGDRILAVRGDGIAAAIAPDGHVVVVAINGGDAPVEEEIDLGALRLDGAPVAVIRTVATEAGGLRPARPAVVGPDGMLRDREPGHAITTYVIERQA